MRYFVFYHYVIFLKSFLYSCKCFESNLQLYSYTSLFFICKILILLSFPVLLLNLQISQSLLLSGSMAHTIKSQVSFRNLLLSLLLNFYITQVTASFKLKPERCACWAWVSWPGRENKLF